jgi:imidazole glycerol phosphate synthase subunit HisF
MSLKTRIIPCLDVAGPRRPQRSEDAQNKKGSRR